MCSGCGHFSKKYVHVLMTLKQSRISSKFQCEVLMIHACVAIAALTREMLQVNLGRIYAAINFACPTMMNHLENVKLCHPAVARLGASPPNNKRAGP